MNCTFHSLFFLQLPFRHNSGFSLHTSLYFIFPNILSHYTLSHSYCHQLSLTFMFILCAFWTTYSPLSVDFISRYDTVYYLPFLSPRICWPVLQKRVCSLRGTTDCWTRLLLIGYFPVVFSLILVVCKNYDVPLNCHFSVFLKKLETRCKYFLLILFFIFKRCHSRPLCVFFCV